MGFYRIPLQRDLAGHVAVGVLVVVALRIDVGPDRFDRTDGVRGFRNSHIANEMESSQHLGAKRFGKNRSSGPLIDVTVGGSGYHQYIAKRARRLEVPHVT